MASILKVRGADGTVHEIHALQGKTAYQYAQEGGYTGSAEDFKAKMAQEGVPTPTAEDAGKVPVVNEDGTGYELGNVAPAGMYYGDIVAGYTLVHDSSVVFDAEAPVSVIEASGLDFTQCTDVYIECDAFVVDASGTLTSGSVCCLFNGQSSDAWRLGSNSTSKYHFAMHGFDSKTEGKDWYYGVFSINPSTIWDIFLPNRAVFDGKLFHPMNKQYINKFSVALETADLYFDKARLRIWVR